MKAMPKTQLTRICVIGAIGEQGRNLAKKLNRKVDLVTIVSDKCKKLPTIPDGCDLYVLWTSFLSHSKSGEVLQNVPKNRIITHHGGLSLMASKLNDAMITLN